MKTWLPYLDLAAKFWTLLAETSVKGRPFDTFIDIQKTAHDEVTMTVRAKVSPAPKAARVYPWRGPKGAA